MLLLIFACSLLPALAVNETPKVQKIPVVSSLSGSALVTQGHETVGVPIKKGWILREVATVETAPGANLSIHLTDEVDLDLEESTRINIPQIGWPAGDLTEVVLEKGKIRWRSTKAVDITLQSPLFSLKPGIGDYVFRIDPAAVQAEALVLKGELTFGAMNGENSVTLKSHEHATFQGTLEDGEIAYDILLKGRKIPRGTLGPVQKASEKDWEKYSAAELKAKVEAQQKALREKLQKAADLKAGMICSAPRALLNRCAWICEGKHSGKGCPADGKKVRCVRRRCNANGQWADDFELPPDQGRHHCQRDPVVQACDY